MRRRELLALTSGVPMLGSAAARAQAIPTIGYLGFTSEVQYGSRLAAFRDGLAAAGFHEGRNVAIIYRWADGQGDRLPALAAELVREQVRVIVTPGSVVAALAAKAATATIPIVFEIGADPQVFGLVASLTRPGGNVTGVTSLNVELGAKRLELLHELVPDLGTAGVLLNPANPLAATTAAHMETAARSRGLQLQVLHAADAAAIDGAFAELVRKQGRGLVIAADQLFVGRVRQLAALALRQALPTIHFTREFPQVGGLMSYGGTFFETHRMTGVYAGRILRGEAPRDLPVQQVSKFEMAINLATAQAIGLAIPPSMITRADEVIE